jgi:hypothetical protein
VKYRRRSGGGRSSDRAAIRAALDLNAPRGALRVFPGVDGVEFGSRCRQGDVLPVRALAHGPATPSALRASIRRFPMSRCGALGSGFERLGPLDILTVVVMPVGAVSETTRRSPVRTGPPRARESRRWRELGLGSSEAAAQPRQVGGGVTGTCQKSSGRWLRGAQPRTSEGQAQRRQCGGGVTGTCQKPVP